MSPPPPSTIRPAWPADWCQTTAWLARLERYHAAPVAVLPGAVAGMHLHGLAGEVPKAYVLLRLPRGLFAAGVAAFPDLPPLAAPTDLATRAHRLAALDAATLATALLRAEPDLCAGTVAAVAAFVTGWRRGRRALPVPSLGTAALYPLRLPTLARALGLDPGHPATAPRRAWLGLTSLAARAGVAVPADAAVPLLAAEADRLAAAMAPLAPLLDAAALRALSGATQYGQDSYRFYIGTSPRAQVRRQAATACPPFARAIAEIPALRRTVDRRRPLIPALARAFGVTEGAVRCLAAAPHRLTPDQIDYLLLFLNDLDGNQRPTSATAWSCFALLAHELNGLAAFIGGWSGEAGGDGRRAALRALLRGFGGDWPALFLAAGGEVHPPDPAALTLPPPPPVAPGDDPLHPRLRALDEERLAAAVAWDHQRFALHLRWNGEAVRDTARAFAYTLCLPLAAHQAVAPGAVPRLDPVVLRAAEAAAVAVLLHGRTFLHAAGLAARFHESLAVLFPAVSVKAVAARGLNLAWPRPSPPLTAPNGLALVPLGSVQALVDEGRALGNCLPFYAVPCAIEGHRVVSLRRDGMSVAALEIARPAPGQPWRLRQIEGPANRPPSPEATAAARWYVDWLAARGPAAPELPPAAEDGDPDVLAALCGYAWRDAAAREAMWRLWTRVLPRAVVRRGPAGLDAHPALARLRAVVAG